MVRAVPDAALERAFRAGEELDMAAAKHRRRRLRFFLDGWACCLACLRLPSAVRGRVYSLCFPRLPRPVSFLSPLALYRLLRPPTTAAPLAT